MNQKTTPWLIALILSVISIAFVVLPSARSSTDVSPVAEDGSVELASLGQTEAVSVRAEIVGEGRREAEMMIYSTTSASLPDGASHEVTVELPDGELVTLQGADLALGKRFSVSRETADQVRGLDPQKATAAEPAERHVFTMAVKLDPESRQQRIVLHNMDLQETSNELLPSPSLSQALILTLTAGPYRFAESGGWEVPIYVIARRRLEGSGELAATPVEQAMSILLEAPGTEPRTVTIEANRARSTEAVFLPVSRHQGLEVTATDLASGAAAGRLEVSWQAHGPKSLELRVFPLTTEGYATRLSPIRLHAHVELDERRLLPGRSLPLQASTSKKLIVEPAEPALDAHGQPVALTVIGRGDGAETLTLQIPDLDLEAEVRVHFRRPYLFLALAALFGVLGVIVARRRQLFEQGKGALALELLAAATGGVLLYAAFLMQWLPAPGFLVGALPASAVGVVGGYGGEAVFQVLLKVVGLNR